MQTQPNLNSSKGSKRRNFSAGGGWDCKNPSWKIGATHPPTTFELVKIGENEVSMTSTCASFTQVMTDKFQFDSQELTKMKCED